MSDKISLLITAEDKTSAAFASAQQGLEKLRAASSSVSAALGALGVSLSAAGFAAFVKSSIDAADQTLKLSQRLGLTVEQMVGWQHVADLADVSTEEFAASVRKLAQAIENEPDKLNALGITAKDANGALLQLADLFARMPDGAAKTALAVDLLGRSGASMIPALNGGADAVRSLMEEGQRLTPITEQMARQAEQFNDNLTRLKKSSAALGYEIAASLLPSLNETVEAMLRLKQEGHWALAMLRGFAGVGKLIWDALIPPEDFSADGQIKERVKQLERLRNELRAREFGGAPASILEPLRQQIKALEMQLDAYQKFKDKIRPPQEANKPSPAATGVIRQAECIAKGGVWDGTRCVMPAKGGKAADPLAGILSQTEAARIADIEQKIALLNERFRRGRVDPVQYAQAFDLLNRQLDDIRAKKDVFGNGSFIAADPSTVRMIREQQEAINELQREMANEAAQAAEAYRQKLDSLISNTPIERTRELLENIQFLDQAFFDGAISAEQHAQAVDLLTGRMEELKDKSKDASDVARELGLTFSSAFEDAVVKGKPLRDVLRGIEEDIQRIIIRKTITEPFANYIGGLGLDKMIGDFFGSLFGGARAEGGPVSPGSWYLVGEKGPEVFVPKTAGTIVPGSAVARISVVNNFSVVGQMDRRSQGQIAAAVGESITRAMRRNR